MHKLIDQKSDGTMNGKQLQRDRMDSDGMIGKERDGKMTIKMESTVGPLFFRRWLEALAVAQTE